MNRKKWGSIALLIVSLVLLYLALRGVPLTDVWATLQTADVRWVGLALTLLLGHYALRALRWQLAMGMMGYRVPFFHLLVALLSGNLANLVLAGSGELTRCGTLQKTDSIPLPFSLSSIVAERWYDLLMMAVGISLTALLERDTFWHIWATLDMDALLHRLPSGSTVVAVGLGCGLLAIVVIKILARRGVTLSAVKLKIQRLVGQFIGGLISVSRSGRLAYFIGYTVLLWVVGLLTFYIIFVALPVSRHITLGGLLTFYSFVSIIGLAAPTQGGVGSFHLAAAYALSLYGFTYNQAIIVASFIHAVQMVANLSLNVLGVMAVSILLKRPIAVAHQPSEPV